MGFFVYVSSMITSEHNSGPIRLGKIEKFCLCWLYTKHRYKPNFPASMAELTISYGRDCRGYNLPTRFEPNNFTHFKSNKASATPKSIRGNRLFKIKFAFDRAFPNDQRMAKQAYKNCYSAISRAAHTLDQKGYVVVGDWDQEAPLGPAFLDPNSTGLWKYLFITEHGVKKARRMCA